MAYTSVSKTDGLTSVWVQLPPPAPAPLLPLNTFYRPEFKDSILVFDKARAYRGADRQPKTVIPNSSCRFLSEELFESVFAKWEKRARSRGTMKIQPQAFLEAIVFNINRLVAINAPPLFAAR